jgi:hypothetical protein
LKDISSIYATCKEEVIAGYSCYSFVIDGTTHYIFGETKEEAFDYMADLINKYGESKQQ